MKKLIALVLCIAVLCTLSVSAFAEKSPLPEKKVSIIIRAAIDEEGKISADKAYSFNIEDSVVKLKFDSNRGKFDSWTIYLVGSDGKAAGEAKEGKDFDYEYLSGDKNSGNVQIKAYKDLIICANYDGAKTDPDASSTGNNSPATADMSVVFVVVSMLAAAAIVYSAKKVSSK